MQLPIKEKEMKFIFSFKQCCDRHRLQFLQTLKLSDKREYLTSPENVSDHDILKYVEVIIGSCLN